MGRVPIFGVRRKQTADELLVRVAGEIDLATAPLLAEDLMAAAVSARAVEVDLIVRDLHRLRIDR